MFGTFEGHPQKVLAWKENPDEFIQELVNQDARDSLHSTIKEKRCQCIQIVVMIPELFSVKSFLNSIPSTIS